MTEPETEVAAGGPDRPVRRVYRLHEDLRSAIKERRIARGQTLANFLDEAVRGELPGLLAALAECGLARDGDGGGARPARLSLSAELLGELRAASRCSGLPAARLLLACLAKAAARKRRRGVRGGRA